jgi:hypothetical protein
VLSASVIFPARERRRLPPVALECALALRVLGMLKLVRLFLKLPRMLKQAIAIRTDREP